VLALNGFRCPRCEGKGVGAHHWRRHKRISAEAVVIQPPHGSPSWRQQVTSDTGSLLYLVASQKESSSSLRRHLGVKYERMVASDKIHAAMKERDGAMFSRRVQVDDAFTWRERCRWQAWSWMRTRSGRGQPLCR